MKVFDNCPKCESTNVSCKTFDGKYDHWICKDCFHTWKEIDSTDYGTPPKPDIPQRILYDIDVEITVKRSYRAEEYTVAGAQLDALDQAAKEFPGCDLHIKGSRSIPKGL